MKFCKDCHWHEIAKNNGNPICTNPSGFIEDNPVNGNPIYQRCEDGGKDMKQWQRDLLWRLAVKGMLVLILASAAFAVVSFVILSMSK